MRRTISIAIGESGDLLLAGGLAPRVLLKIGHGEERAPGMRPNRPPP